MCTVRVKGCFRTITMVSVYAPIDEKSDEEKEVFYESLAEVCANVQRYDMVVIMSDFHAKIGKEEFTQCAPG